MRSGEKVAIFVSLFVFVAIVCVVKMIIMVRAVLFEECDSS